MTINIFEIIHSRIAPPMSKEIKENNELEFFVVFRESVARSYFDVTAGGGEQVWRKAPETGLRQYFGDARMVYGRRAGHLATGELRERETVGADLGWLKQKLLLLLLLLLRYGERRRRLRLWRSQSYRVGGRAVEYQLPLFEYTGLVYVPVTTVVYGHCPRAVHLLAPVVHAQKRPVVEVGADHVPGSFEQQCGRGAQRRGQVDAQIAPREEPQRYFALHVLGESHFVQRALTSTHLHGHGQRAVRSRVDLPVKKHAYFAILAAVVRRYK